MPVSPRFYMVGVIAQDLDATTDFYQRLGLDFDTATGSHREARVGELTVFVDGQPSIWHPTFDDRPYSWLLEFYFESLADLEAKMDELAEAGYEVLASAYKTGFGMWFAFVADPEQNTILLSAEA